MTHEQVQNSIDVFGEEAAGGKASAHGPRTIETRRDWLRKAFVRQQAEVQAMHWPVGMTEAYRLMGLLLGTLPPAAIFWKLFHFGFAGRGSFAGFFINEPVIFFAILLVMNMICALAGYLTADVFTNDSVCDPFGQGFITAAEMPVERPWWPSFTVRLPFLGAFWGVVTGAAGGVLFFVFGAIFGLLCAIPVGVVGFTSFGVLHRMFERNGMIEASRLVPLAVGVAGVITAFILSIQIQ